MQGYRHVLTQSEIKYGRINLSRLAVEEVMRVLGQVRDKPFNIFRADGKLLKRNVYFQRSGKKGGLRLNCGQYTFRDCTVGTPIWLRLRPDGDVEIQIGSPPGPIIDTELKKECEHILENPDTENYWQAVTTACTLLETRLRNRAQARANVYGVRLVDYALKPPDGKLVCREHGGEQEGVHQLCRGVIQALRNPSSHQKQEYSRTRARQVVGVVDYLLGEIDAAEVREGK